MFLGHFALAFAAKKADPRPSLGTYFIAAQWLDLVWPVFLLAGVETVAIDPGNSVTTPLQFVYYPYSHSLLLVLGWSLMLGFVYYLKRRSVKSAVLVGTLVLSHWLLDLLVHVPDLPLTPSGETKLGIGLWNDRLLTLAVELFIFGVGLYLYLKATKAVKKSAGLVFWALVIFLIAIYLSNIFGPPPPSVKTIALAGFAQWLLVAWAYWADAKRVAPAKMASLR